MTCHPSSLFAVTAVLAGSAREKKARNYPRVTVRMLLTINYRVRLHILVETWKLYVTLIFTLLFRFFLVFHVDVIDKF